MILDLLLLALGWLPLWAVALLLRPRFRASRIAMGAALTGAIGGMCAAELRRHGIAPAAAGSIPLIPLLDLRLEDVLRFAFLGGSAAFLLDNALDRVEKEEAAPAD